MSEFKLNTRIKSLLVDFLQRLKSIYQDELISVILYGSAASGEFVARRSNLNILVVLKNTDLNQLRKAASLINAYKFRAISPLFLTPGYIRNSTDVFPLEFLDMKENYLVLSGEDILKNLIIDTKNLRFQCEQELKVKLLQVKSFYLRIRDKVALRNMLFKTTTSLLHILRNVLRLKGVTPPYLKEEILAAVTKEFSIETMHFKRILEVKKQNTRISLRELENLLAGFIIDLEAVIDKVDSLFASV